MEMEESTLAIPHLKDTGGKKCLMVHDKPYIMLSGEVHNSNSSSVAYMEGVWDKAESLGMNSLLLPISWEMVEPREDVFDFSLVDGLIKQARRRKKKLVLLWFGAWKNAQCMYAPGWVKMDLERFARAEVVKGQHLARLKDFYGMSYTSLSYLCEATKKADAKAFRELMLHLKAVDAHENTVIAVQVENETGVQGAAREHSNEADKLFAMDVPVAFIDHMKASTATMASDVKAAVEAGVPSGSWSEVFGEVAEEMFSAYHIASYVNAVALAGKEVYPLPMIANCWLDKGQAPGIYPSGGPVARMMEAWKCCAPDIDIIAPDIYAPNFCDLCDDYVKLDNPLFIPETGIHCYAGPRMVYTVGHHHALCYAPFGFEEMGKPMSSPFSALFGADTEDPMLSVPQDVEEYCWYAKTLDSMMDLLASRYGTDDLQAVLCERSSDDTMLFGGIGFKAMMDLPVSTRKDGVCLVLKQDDDVYYVVANGCLVAPFSTDPSKPNIDFLDLEEGEFENGQWKMHRRLNGDELHLMPQAPVLLKVRLFAYN